MNNNDDWLRRYARRQREPLRAAKLRALTERQVQFEQHRRRKDARLQRLQEKATMWTTDEIKGAQQRFNALFPTRFGLLLCQLQHYAQTLQRFDATFYDREPILDVSKGLRAQARRCDQCGERGADHSAAQARDVLRRHRGERR